MYAVELSDEQREHLLDLVRTRTHRDSGRRKRVYMLLLTEERQEDTAMADALGVNRRLSRSCGEGAMIGSCVVVEAIHNRDESTQAQSYRRDMWTERPPRGS